MSKKRYVEFFIIDILLATERIKRYTSRYKKPNSLLHNEQVYDAVMRELEIIGEAMKYVVASIKFDKTVNPEWRKVIDFRNIVIHEYFGIDIDEVFYIIKSELPKFTEDFLTFIKNIDDKKILLEVIESAQIDMKNMKRKESLMFLEKVKKELK